jgi:beta-N-acetylhexosaminidase
MAIDRAAMLPLMHAAIVGISGPTLLDEEAALFRRHPPAGVILFARNIQDPPQLAALTASLRRALPRNAVLMVDQEGGRVARLRPPHWRAHPPAAAIGRLFASDRRAGLRAAFLTGALIGLDCRAAGFDVAAAPVLDLGVAGASNVIGDRAFAADPIAVARLGRATAAGLLAAGIQPVGKHAPGHGRALVDSHLALPRVHAGDLRADLLPFARNTHLPWLMTAHIVYAVWDPLQPATVSSAVIKGIIRGRLGFGGIVTSDDLAMQALSGTPAQRAAAALAAGCDIALYCAGDLEPTAELLATAPLLSPEAAGRLDAAWALAASRRRPLNPQALEVEREQLLA